MAYDVSVEIANPSALDVSNIPRPIVMLPMSAWNKMSQKGLRFALKLSPDIFVVQIQTGSSTEDDLRAAVAGVRRSPDERAPGGAEARRGHWYEHLLHNKRAALLNALLLVRGDPDSVMINVPWYLSI
jgi:hypothetical protein